MTLRYLDAGYPVALPTGSGKITVSPPNGQFWIPRLVRVGVTYPSFTFYPNNHQQMFCSLYHGGTGDTGLDAFVDGTGNGSGDVTTILNGTLIQTGEYLTAAWNILDLGTASVPDPTATGFMQIVGLTADTIAEATAALASAVPGPRFQSPIPNTMATPQAASTSVLNIFQNPGQGNSVQMYAASVSYVYNVNILTGAVLANADGYLSPLNRPNFKFAYYNPGSAGLAVPVVWNFNGMRLDTGGVNWVQGGSAAINSITYAVDIAYRATGI